MVYNLSEQKSIINQFLAELRDVNIQKDAGRFRRNLERIGEVCAYEISKTLEYHPAEVQTPFGITKTELPEENIVLATILRAGLPLHKGTLNVFDRARNAFISAYRRNHKDGSFEIKLDYISCPDLEGSVLILTDPLVATGASVELVLKELLQHGKPKVIHLVVAIASKAGLDHVQRLFPDVRIWLGALDEELTAKSYIVPGLGDAGDLAYGPKVQE